MAFRIKRGLVLHTTKLLRFHGQRLVAGTRVKAMRRINRDTIQVKVQDVRYPEQRGEWLQTSFDNVIHAGRTWPRMAHTAL